MKVLLVKANALLLDKEIKEIRKDILNQINDGGVLVLDNCYKTDVVEFDSMKVGGEFVD